MPSQILHTLFGEDLIDCLYRLLFPRFGIVAQRAREKVAEEFRAAFTLGCQGPDIFYHNQMTRPVGLEYGTLLHRRGCGVFTGVLLKMALPDPPASAEDVRAHRKEGSITALGAYALGFMTHAILDRACHPYIVYKTAITGAERKPGPVKGVNSRNIHAFFERIIDALMLEERRGIPVAAWDQETLVAICEAPPPGLRELLAQALCRTFPERAGKDIKLAQRMDNTFRDCADFFRITAPKRTTLHSKDPQYQAILEEMPLVYLYPEDLPSDADYLNREHSVWYYPLLNGPEYTLSFPELYAEAVEAAGEDLSGPIAKYLETGAFPIMEAAQTIGNGGLSIQDEAGKPCAPTRTRPLPLEAVLDQQRRLRGIRI
ncbi:hypothetical protein TREPR_1953 [Treponema primitia ZAS-2]|uniref:Phospholipase C/D domain-containing protein n=1 Tax=Treponema primitia (strain ATCC BAA-887 / DSM 12427 / ZAS-2) TaxID=545694 RepID=F5YKI2_TREPZ|nr:zinc dependent phospholipase C family protein [Treponema primitia]AEF87005.1 hypothetical protein TREPR_1953 [Treponema primitia ZAS-2]